MEDLSDPNYKGGFGGVHKEGSNGKSTIISGSKPKGGVLTGSQKRSTFKRLAKMMYKGKKYKPYESDLPPAARGRGYGEY